VNFTDGKDINLITDCLKKGGLVIAPTDTVYIAMTDTTNQKAIDKLLAYKNRPMGKPLSVGVTDKNMASLYADINKTAENLYDNFLPGPLTIVSVGKHNLAIGVESETGTLGVRVPDLKWLLDLIGKYKKPLTVTSANASYKKRPYKISDILDNLSKKQKKLIDLIVDVGELPKNEPSTVIDTTLDDLVILRQGNFKIDNKNEVLSRNEENTTNIGKELWQKYEQYQGQRAIVFALMGEMGAGKTVMTKGIARAMGITDEVISPTFTLEAEYDKGKLVHIDTWRMENGQELGDLGFGERIKNKQVLVIEWADKVAEIIRGYDDEAVIIWVKIEYGKEDDQRIINWEIL
jgi:L-threonylcarbamoyladenylate synthase